MLLSRNVSFVEVAARRRPYIDDPECPRKPELAKNRQCLKKCLSDLDCKSKKRRCLCDGVCGRSCVKPSEFSWSASSIQQNESTNFCSCIVCFYVQHVSYRAGSLTYPIIITHQICIVIIHNIIIKAGSLLAL